jgi:RNA polymerase sigma-70 factor (ECF subfamily)
MLSLDLRQDRWSSLVRQCTRVTGDAHDAEDAVQDAAVAVLRRLPALDPDATDLDAYLAVAARHAALKISTRRRPCAQLHDALPDDARPTAELAELGELRASLRAAVAGIPERQRAALLLFDVAGLDGTEVGERLGLDANAVAQLVFRARRSMRAQLGEHPLAA